MSEQINQLGYQPSNTEIAQEEEQNNILLDLLGGTALVSGAGAGIVAERARRKQKKEGGSYDANFKGAATDILKDLNSAQKVVRGKTEYDDAERFFALDSKEQERLEKRLIDSKRKVPNASDPRYRSLLEYAEKAQDPLINLKSDSVYSNNPFTQAAVAARDAFNPSSEDFLSVGRSMRRDQGQSPEGPRSQVAVSRIPIVDALREILPSSVPGTFSEQERLLRKEHGISLVNNNRWQGAGSLIGRAASDFVNNGVRSAWWLINAPQAVSDLVSEEITSRANKEGLYGVDYAGSAEAKKRGWVDADGNPLNSHVSSVYYDLKDDQMNPHLRKQIASLPGQVGQKVYSRRRVGNNLSTLLALPAAVGINQGLGLNNPFGGSDGFKALYPSEEDPTQTENVIAEVASKYILGRSGDLLPWDEFKKVRPDVSKSEYMAYKGYKFNKSTDINPFDDGRMNLFNGILKSNNDGINGAEIQFLGKSMPWLTTLIPTMAAASGAAVGASLARYGTNSISGINTEMNRLETEAQKAYDRGDLDTKNKLIATMANLGRRQEAMSKNPLFKRLNRTRVIGAGLAGGGAALLGSSLVGHEIERRRREGKIQERQERGY